ncbi:MAG: hypothetical protein WC508_06185 [Patescibacteria group bacterium]
MKKVIFGVCVLLIAGLVGCGSLKNYPLPLERNLTPGQAEMFEALDGDHYSVLVPGLFSFKKILVMERTQFRVSKMLEILNPLPFIGPGFKKANFADFSPEGKLTMAAQQFELKPFFYRLQVKTIDANGQSTIKLVSTRILVVFGHGRLEGKPFTWIFGPIGERWSDLKEAIPKKIVFED